MMLRTTTISFPGLGIGEFNVNSVAIKLKLWDWELEIAWYGLIITLGMILAVVYVMWRAKSVGYAPDHIIDCAFWTIVLGVIGARLYYVFSKWSYYGQDLKEIFNLRGGGLGIYGGIIGGALGILIFCRIKKRCVRQLTDCIAPAVMIGQLLGRWGNFFNGEAFGAETSLPWRMGVNNFANTGGETLYVHPTFLYESLWNILGFVLINIFFKKRRYNGQITLMYFGWYGFGRMWIELLRSDSLYLFELEDFWFMKISFLLGALFFAVCTALLVYLWHIGYREDVTEAHPFGWKFALANFKEAASNRDEEQVNDAQAQEKDSEIKTINNDGGIDSEHTD